MSITVRTFVSLVICVCTAFNVRVMEMRVNGDAVPSLLVKELPTGVELPSRRSQ